MPTKLRGRCAGLLGAALLGLTLPVAAQEAEKPAEAPAAPKEASPSVVLPAGTHIPLVLQNSVNTKSAQVGDPLYFETVYPVTLNNRILVPVGSFVRGTLTQVKRPGRIKGRGELHVRFDELTLPNGYTVSLSASLAGAAGAENEEVDRKEGGVKGDTRKGEDVGTVATTTTVGAGIGGIAGGGKGTAIGAGAGAAAGLAAVLLTRGPELQLPRGSSVDIVLSRPLELDSTLTKFDWTGQSSSLPGPTPRPRDRRPVGSRIPF